ncbi:MAG TPA: hypothetical protein VJS64_20155, partial [Pyrinomonadaceae bacterium]|nr:hypothetical protein [Pyrinomonadaceae bacterium]
ETLTALLHFSAAPAINFCHSSKLWLEAPLLFPRVRRYVAVDHACRDRLVHEHGIDEKRIAVLLNFVDLERFKPRLAPLPDRPRRALIFSNYANEQTHLPCVREACQRAGIELELAGAGVGRERSNMESMLQGYELVFAKARCALEALAVGSAVILCDAGGAGPMVTSREFDQLRPLNFGIRTLRNPLHPDFVLREIERYDANDATMVSQRVRTTAGHETVIDQLIDLYHEVIEEHRTLGEDAEAEGRAAAAYLRHLKIDFAAHGAASMRLRERLQGIPLLRGVGNKLVQMIIRERR